MKTSKLKKLALYTSIVIGSGFFITACDNGSSTDGAESAVVEQKPQVMSPQEQVDFIKNVMTNYVTKYNASQYFATASIERFSPDKDQQILMDVKLVLALDGNKAPRVANISYLISPEQVLIDSAYTVAKFTSQNISYSSSKNDSESAIVTQFIAESGLLSTGYIMASKNIINDIKTSNDFNYTNEGALWNQISQVDFSAFNYHAKTRDDMNLVDITYHLPLVALKYEGMLLSLENINLTALNHSLDENFNYTGDDEYRVDSISIKNDDGKQTVVNNIIWQSKTEVIDNKTINIDGKTSFSGVFSGKTNQNVDFSASANIVVQDLNLSAFKSLNTISYNGSKNTHGKEKEYFLDIVKDGFSFAITDSHIKFNNEEGSINFTVKMEPLSLPPRTSYNKATMQVLNNVSIDIDSNIPTKWFIIWGINKDQNQIDTIINRAIEQLDMFGYGGALNYDGKTITAKFKIEKGNVFVNGELKGSIMTALAGFM